MPEIIFLHVFSVVPKGMKFAQQDCDAIKRSLLKQIIYSIEQERGRSMAAANSARSASTHESAVAKSKYETQGTELSYLADGQAMRALELSSQLEILNQLMAHGFNQNDSVTVGSLVSLSIKDAVRTFFLLPVGAGIPVEHEGLLITVVTTKAPLGQQLLSARVGDELSNGGVVLSIL